MMDASSAEDAYLFRHSLVRDAAYELQPLSERGRLHELALGIIEALHGGEPPLEVGEWSRAHSAHVSDPLALELSTHAECACEGRPGSAALARKAAIYLKRAAWHDDTSYRTHEALRLYERLSAHPGAEAALRVQAHIGAGQMYYRLGEIANAGTHYEAAAKLIDPARDPQGAMVVRTCIAIIDSHSDNGPGPAMVHKQAAEFWHSVGNLHGEVSGLVNYAIWHCEFGDEAQGEAALLHAVELAHKTGNPRVEAAAIGNLATLWNKQGRVDKAEQAMRRAIEISREGQNPVTEVTWILGLANLHRGAQRYAESEDGYRQARKRAAETGLEARVDFADSQLAVLFVDIGRAADARPLWDRAWSRILARGDEYTTASIRRAMTEALEEKGLPLTDWQV